MPVPVSVKIIDNTNLFVKYSDGIEGSISIKNIFDSKNFNESSICIDDDTKNIIVSNSVLCKNAIYKQLHLKNLMSRLKIDLTKI